MKKVAIEKLLAKVAMFSILDKIDEYYENKKIIQKIELINREEFLIRLNKLLVNHLTIFKHKKNIDMHWHIVLKYYLVWINTK